MRSHGAITGVEVHLVGLPTFLSLPCLSFSFAFLNVYMRYLCLNRRRISSFCPFTGVYNMALEGCYFFIPFLLIHIILLSSLLFWWLFTPYIETISKTIRGTYTLIAAFLLTKYSCIRSLKFIVLYLCCASLFAVTRESHVLSSRLLDHYIIVQEGREKSGENGKESTWSMEWCMEFWWKRNTCILNRNLAYTMATFIKILP